MRDEGESILEFEIHLIALRALENPPIPFRHETVAISQLLDAHVGHQGQRITGAVTEAHIDQPGLIESDMKDHVIERDSETTFRSSDFGSKHLDSVPQLSQQPSKGGIELVAETAAPFLDDLLQYLVFIYNDGHT